MMSQMFESFESFFYIRFFCAMLDMKDEEVEISSFLTKRRAHSHSKKSTRLTHAAVKIVFLRFLLYPLSCNLQMLPADAFDREISNFYYL